MIGNIIIPMPMPIHHHCCGTIPLWGKWVGGILLAIIVVTAIYFIIYLIKDWRGEL